MYETLVIVALRILFDSHRTIKHPELTSSAINRRNLNFMPIDKKYFTRKTTLSFIWKKNHLVLKPSKLVTQQPPHIRLWAASSGRCSIIVLHNRPSGFSKLSGGLGLIQQPYWRNLTHRLLMFVLNRTTMWLAVLNFLNNALLLYPFLDKAGIGKSLTSSCLVRQPKALFTNTFNVKLL